MKIILSNKFYYRRGGDCIYMLNLEGLLRAKGHEVAVLAMAYSENNETPWSTYFPREMTKVMAFSRPFGSREVKRQTARLIDDFRPDVLHMNNIHTHLSPVMAEVAKSKGVRVVWTLHDYKLLCPRYDCLKGGVEVCEACFDGSKVGCLKNRCMKGSLLQSAIGYAEAMTWHRARLEQCTDAFICPSAFMATKMVEGGFNPTKMHTLCNFIDTAKCDKDDYSRSDYYCYIGRLSHEKGVSTLIKAANTLPYKLKIIGGGPLEAELKAVAKSHIEFVGYKGWNEIKSIVGQARFTVIPSEWYENNPLSVIEAQCLGTPVVGARIGGIPELIEEGVTGMTFTSRDADDLARAISTAWGTTFDNAAIAAKSLERYNAEKYYNEIIKIYQQ